VQRGIPVLVDVLLAEICLFHHRDDSVQLGVVI
jgi:hypothetical protein